MSSFYETRDIFQVFSPQDLDCSRCSLGKFKPWSLNFGNSNWKTSVLSLKASDNRNHWKAQHKINAGKTIWCAGEAVQMNEWGRISSGMWFSPWFWTVYSLPPASGAGDHWDSPAVVIEGSVNRALSDAQPRPWLGQRPSLCAPSLLGQQLLSPPHLPSKQHFPQNLPSCRCAGAAARAAWVPAEADPSQGTPSGLWFNTDLPYLSTSRRDAQTSQDPLDQHQGIKGDWLVII